VSDDDLTTEMEDVLVERLAVRLLVGVAEALNWRNTRAQVSILRALQRVSLSLVTSLPPLELTREQMDDGMARLMQALTAWRSSVLTTPKEGGAA